MRKRAFVFSFVMLTVFALSATAVHGADMFSGTWKTNIARSTYTPGPPPTPKEPAIQKITSLKNGMKFVVDGVNAAGQKAHSEWTVTFDGKEGPLMATLDGKPTPNAADTTYSGKKIDDFTFEITIRNKGHVVDVARNVVSKDGKTRTATRTGTDPKGQAFKDVVIFEKQ